MSMRWTCPIRFRVLFGLGALMWPHGQRQPALCPIRSRVLFGLGALMVAFSCHLPVEAAPPSDASEGNAFRQSVDRAVAFLKKQQTPNGAFAEHMGIGVTAIATTALLRSGQSPNDPFVEKSLKYLEGYAQPDGGIYKPKTFLRNYETCLAVLCFSKANRHGRYDKLIASANRYIKDLQWDEGEGSEQASLDYGGGGYGKHKRPDMSNTQFLVDALRAAGNGPDDESIQKALVFVSRCQNFESEHNKTPFAMKNSDGGFYYTVADGGSSKAGTLPNGGLRSYGSMTYAGLKSMIFAGVGPDDPRVKAAFGWIRKHYDVTENPGMGKSGLYYYYHTFAKALDAMGIEMVEDSQGKKHDWRRELRTQLIHLQRADGSWLNDNDRWFEGDPSLVTSYALLALAYCHPTSKSQKN